MVVDHDADRLLFHLLRVVARLLVCSLRAPIATSSYTTSWTASRRTLQIRYGVHAGNTPDASPPSRVVRSTQRRRDRFGFRLAEVGQSVPILTTVQDAAFGEPTMLTAHNRSKAASPA